MRAQLSPGEHPALLVVARDALLRRLLKQTLDGYELVFADDHDSAVASLRRHEPVVALIDLAPSAHGQPAPAAPPAADGAPAADPRGSDEFAPTEFGLNTIERLLALAPATRIIVLTGPDDRASARRAIGIGAHDSLARPVAPDKLRPAVEHAFRVAELEMEDRRANDNVAPPSVDGIVTRDPAMLRLCRQIAKLAQANEPVMLIGETGTGKQALARALHEQSSRHPYRFVTMHCASIPDHLVEAELFGAEVAHGAGLQITQGRLEQADGGTLFLGEIDGLRPAIQQRLLRFLETGTIRRVGGDADIALDVRVVSSTLRSDLNAPVGARLHDALHLRLARISVLVPPLRDRAGDSALLAHHFVRSFGHQHGRERLTLTDSALNAITAHNWPGNVRELENCIRRAVLVAEGRAVTANDLGLIARIDEQTLNLRRIRDDAERHAVLKVMAHSDGNVARAAELLGVSRPTLYDLLNRFGLR